MKRKIIPYNPTLKQLARNLRNDSTLGEVLLWNELSGKKFFGYDFHRQKPLLNYIVDFYCHELSLVIEIDGRYHNEGLQYSLDMSRENELKKYGLTILRFEEMEIRRDMFNVLRTLETHVLNSESN